MSTYIRSTIITIGIITSLILQSCNKWLDLQPQDGLIADEYWKTKEQLDAASMGCYASLLGGSVIPVPKYLFIWGELRADMVEAGVDPSSDEEFALLSPLKRDEVNMLRSDILPTNTLTNWEAIYKTINYCNNVIKNAATVKKNDPTLSEESMNAYIAEARGLRGLMYFYLLRTFGEVPKKTEPTSSDDEVKPLAKATSKDIYDLIVDDLIFAAENALPGYNTLAEEKGRINRYTAYTILADVYLWGEEYQKSLDAGNQVIQSGKYNLFPQFSTRESWFNSVFEEGNSVEGIFEIQFTTQKQNPFWNMFVLNREFATAEWVAKGDLYGNDASSAINNDIRGNNASILDANASINKYTSGKSSANSNTHWFVYRYSDVLLMRAEALTWVEPGNATNGKAALDIVDDIRRKRNALSLVGERIIERPDASQYEKISDYILEERAREFAYEGKRWFDVLRFAKRKNYSYKDIMLDVIKRGAPANKQQTVVNKYKDIRSHYLPIYYYELQTNKALVQNPFYQ